jgi:hypothetical protein
MGATLSEENLMHGMDPDQHAEQGLDAGGYLMGYADFLDARRQWDAGDRVPYRERCSMLYDFQHFLTEFALDMGRSAVFADCGLGKTPIQLSWADNVVRHCNKPVLIATPLAVGHQLVLESEKFGFNSRRSPDGKTKPGDHIVITNYERLEMFDPNDFAGMVCDESSILKNFDGKRRKIVTEFMRTLPYRLLCTATAAPNDYIELGTSSEALGAMGHADMLSRFFRNEQNNSSHRTMRMRGQRELGSAWRFKGHAEEHFWRWVCSWARAVRKPSDIGFDDGDFKLPKLTETTHEIDVETTAEGMLFDLPARGLHEQREERKRTIKDRCEYVAGLAEHDGQALVWCHLNDEGNALEKMIPDAVQVSGRDSDDAKEERLIAFGKGEIRVLITKPKIGAWGLNFQSCNHVTIFPSHSYEQYYQSIRRCWRFGQKRPVTVDIVSTSGDRGVLQNQNRKAKQAEVMSDALVAHMNNSIPSNRYDLEFREQETIPKWL